VKIPSTDFIWPLVDDFALWYSENARRLTFIYWHLWYTSGMDQLSPPSKVSEIVEAVNRLLASGISLTDACEDTGVTVYQYLELARAAQSIDIVARIGASVENAVLSAQIQAADELMRRVSSNPEAIRTEDLLRILKIRSGLPQPTVKEAKNEDDDGIIDVPLRQIESIHEPTVAPELLDVLDDE